MRAVGMVLPEAVLIVGHMRSGSTLLLHLLMTSSEVIGCGERNAVYRSPRDLDDLAVSSAIAQRRLRGIRYAADQVNHDHLTPDPRLLLEGRVRCIFLVREPRAAIDSIIRLAADFYQPWPLARAVDYYSQRLASMAAIARMLHGHRPFLALTHDQLIGETPGSLRRIESFLDLGDALGEHYRLHGFTGSRGDPGEAIRSGRIQRGRGPVPCEMSARELDRAADAYSSCLEALQHGRRY